MSAKRKKIGVVVDPFSTGGSLSSSLSAHGYDLIGVWSTPDVSEDFRKSFRSEFFCKQLTFDGDFKKLKQAVKDSEVSFVTSGAESGVFLAEELASALGLPGNDSTTSKYRRNKAQMGVALHQNGIRCARQIIVRSENDLDKAAINSIGYPIVAKPTESAGSDSVLIANSFDEIVEHYAQINGQKNVLGRKNEEMLLMEFLDGDQYIVNSISYEGQHFVTEVWQDVRMQVGGQVLYDHEYLIDRYSPIAQQLATYVESCLTALQVKYGPVHAEVMMTAKGPMLIEIGARCQGAIMPEVVEKAIGFSHTSLTADLIHDPKAVVHRLQHIEYQPCIMAVSLNSYRAGFVERAKYADILPSLTSFAAIMSMPKEGDYVPRTENLFMGLGVIYFVNDDLDMLLTDLAALRKMEQEGALLDIVDLPQNTAGRSQELKKVSPGAAE